MLKVLIVDDEQLIRRCLQNEIPWSEHDIEVMATAKNGVEALKLLREMEIDVVITDIKMPRMTGIELIENALSRGITSRFIILSGYGEFEYAKQAVNLGACSYLLKPIEPSELLEAVIKIRDKIHAENHTLSSFFRKIVFGTCTGVEYDQGLNDFPQLRDVYFGVLLVQVDILCHSQGRHFYQNLQELLNNWQQTGDNFVLVDDSPQNIISIIFDTDKVRLEAQIEKAAKGLQDFFFMRDFLAFTVAKGDICSATGDIEKSYFSALKYSNLKYVKGNSLVLGAESCFKGWKPGNNTLREVEKALIHDVLINDKMRMREHVEALFEEFGREKVTYEQLRLVISNITGDLLYQDIFTQINVEQINEVIQENFAQLFIMNDIDELKYKFNSMLLKIGAFLNQRHGSSSEQIVQKVKEYVGRNYSDKKLSLSTIAKELNFTPAYLSALFSNLCGFSLSYYINQIRIEKAKYRLQCGDSKINNIANDIGYENTTYFSTIFKKYIGVSPKEYRSIHTISEDKGEMQE